MEDKPIAYDAWEELAEAYSLMVEKKAHNAFYERPATLSLLPTVKGKRVLDAGCGPGVYSKLLLEQGAEVLGIDASPKMIELAQKRTGSKAQFILADLNRPLSFLEDQSFDIVLSALALDYVKDWETVFCEFFRVLRTPGVLVFSAGHPFPDFYKFQDKANYFEVEAIEFIWCGFGFDIAVPFYRRPLSEIFNPLIAAGFIMDQVLEPQPVPEFRREAPEDYKKLMKRPGFICIRALKI
jgi:ubiquinone/menaquinone biosynthesis C-methylase UbiE